MDTGGSTDPAPGAEPGSGARRGAVRAWFAPGFEPASGPDPGAFLDAVFALTPRRWLRRIPGRETFRHTTEEGTVQVVKRTVGGEARDYWYDRLRRTGRTPRSPARREAENLVELAADGVRVPRVLAWAEEARAARHPRRGGRSALVMEHVAHASSLRDRLALCARGERSRLTAALLELVARLHARGWIHRDLYLQHVVVADEAGAPELTLLDVGRARRLATPRTRWLVKDLAALHSSLPPEVPRTEALRFLRGWLDRRGGAERAVERRWIRGVLRKAHALARHRPRYLDPGDPVDAGILAR
jgi:tRNA A-37 threonylcarbamoyl transferase component Bud32